MRNGVRPSIDLSEEAFFCYFVLMPAPRITLSLFLLTFFTFAGSENILACECTASEFRATTSDAYERAETVMTATVVSEPDPNVWFDQQWVKVRVEKVYKGSVKVEDLLTFGQGVKTDCIWHFTKENMGKPYLFYLGKPTGARPYKTNEETEKSSAEPKYYVSTCGRSRGIGDAAGDISDLDDAEMRRGRSMPFH